MRAGTAKPVRDPAWLTKLFKDRIEKIERGFGIEKLTLAAIMVEPLAEKQNASSLIEEEVRDVTPLIDILGNRGGQRIYRAAPVASDVPERSIRLIAPTAEEKGETWPSQWQRPPRLLARPDPIEVIALLPDHPPVSITWRGRRHRVARADGPERIFGEWWLRRCEFQAVRDYFIVESESGERFWIFRSGDGVDAGTGSHKWFLHGLFA